jgi:hypothetical protein
MLLLQVSINRPVNRQAMVTLAPDGRGELIWLAAWRRRVSML